MEKSGSFFGTYIQKLLSHLIDFETKYKKNNEVTATEHLKGLYYMTRLIPFLTENSLLIHDTGN